MFTPVNQYGLIVMVSVSGDWNDNIDKSHRLLSRNPFSSLSGNKPDREYWNLSAIW